MKISQEDEELPLLNWRRPLAEVVPFPPARWRGEIREQARLIAEMSAWDAERRIHRWTGEVGLNLVSRHCDQFLVGRLLNDLEAALRLAVAEERYRIADHGGAA